MKSKKKKTIIFSTYDDLYNPYYAGGGARAIYEVAKRLSTKYNIIIVTGNYPGAAQIEIDNISYKRIGPPFLGPHLGQLAFHFLLPYAVRRESFDVWVESFTPPFSASSLQQYTKKPVVGLAHMLSAEDMQRKYKLPFYLIENRGLKRYKYFITLTKETKQKIYQHNRQAKFYIIPNGVEFATRKSSLKKKFILFLGRIEVNQKGLDLLLDSFAKIVMKTNTTLLIAGSGTKNEESKLKDIIKQKHLQKKVILQGRVDGKKKEQLLATSSYIVLPSRFETFGNVILEAFAYGKPAIGFAIKGLRWVPSSCMIKVKPFSTEELAKQMLNLLNNKDLQNRMSKSTQRIIKQYSWDKTAQAYGQVIESVI